MTTPSLSTPADATETPNVSVLLRRHGLRCTPSRLHILALLSSSELHLSSAETWAELDRRGTPYDQATVYRTLETLTAAGLIHAVHGPGPKRYGVSSETHHHAVCEQCGQVNALTDEGLGEAVERVAELAGLKPGAAGSLLIYGRCVRCGE
ncbi:Fur family transcriptional regulator [Streptomyces sp. NPDC088254]|uniref:Fur family transcriptional regulator n=1 Tax=Streptomyces sp. NPDC088254 TaxID=3365847 RepID=UPI00382FB7C8